VPVGTRMAKRLTAFVIMVAALALAGCCYVSPIEGEASQRLLNRIGTGPAQHQSYQVDPEGAEQVQVDLQFGGGEIEVLPGSSEALLDAEFVYNLDAFEPEVSYQVQEGRGELTIRQDPTRIAWQPAAQIRNEWRLELGNGVPLAMACAVGASHGTIELGGLRLAQLELDSGAADLTVQFSAANPEQMQSFVVRSGAARLKLLGLGNAGAETLHFDGGLGTYVFDFQGAWQRPMKADILAGASQVELRIPRDIGVQVCPGDLRSGDYGGLQESGSCYVNERYGEADIRLDVNLDVGLGELQIRQVDQK
jgi:hypothetical protein